MVFRSILFHRSLEGSDLSRNMTNLMKEEIISYCDGKHLQLIKFLMISVNQTHFLLGFEDKYR